MEPKSEAAGSIKIVNKGNDGSGVQWIKYREMHSNSIMKISNSPIILSYFSMWREFL